MPYPSSVDAGGNAGSQYLYLPAGWDTPWKTAKANAKNQRVYVTGIGDSITLGWGSTDIMTTSWWSKVRASVLAANGNLLGGDHFEIVYSSVFTTVFGGPGTATPPLVFSGVEGTDYTYHAGMFGVEATGINALSPFCTCTPPYAVVGFDIVYMDYSAGTWTYSVDGGAAQAVTCTGPGTNAGATLKKVSITGLTAGSHTLTINCSTSAIVCNICGITTYAANSGICFANMGLSGMGLVNSSAGNILGSTATFPPDKIGLYQGYQGTTAAPTSLTGLGFPTQPDLAFISLGVNDAPQSVTKTAFRDSLDQLIWALRRGKNDACSIVITAMWVYDGTLATSTSVANGDYTASTATAYRDIKAAMREAAEANICAFVDVHSMFGRTPIANGWITSTSNLHPTSAGHQKIANLISPIL